MLNGWAANKNERITLKSFARLFQNSIFNTGSGGGGNISQYEFYFLEKHLPNLSHQFLFDFKADNSLLNYRANSLYFKPTTFIPVLLLQNHLNDVENKKQNQLPFSLIMIKNDKW